MIRARLEYYGEHKSWVKREPDPDETFLFASCQCGETVWDVISNWMDDMIDQWESAAWERGESVPDSSVETYAALCGIFRDAPLWCRAFDFYLTGWKAVIAIANLKEE